MMESFYGWIDVMPKLYELIFLDEQGWIRKANAKERTDGPGGARRQSIEVAMKSFEQAKSSTLPGKDIRFVLFHNRGVIDAVAAKEWNKDRPYFVRFFYPQEPTPIQGPDSWQYNDMVKALHGESIDSLESAVRRQERNRIGLSNYRAV